MSELNRLENHLRSWVPRPPSPEIEARLFGATAAPAAEPLAGLWQRAHRTSGNGAWHWLAPAMALCVLMLTLHQPGSTALVHGIVSANRAINPTSALKNPQLAAYCDSERHSGRNAWPTATFRWTNSSRSWAPALTPIDVWTTNQIMR